jgi:osmoprotectant transport system ATP-binding protein
MLELQEVTKLYAGAPVLSDITLSVPEARTTVFIGPSGCGKSTLLRLINGLIAPDRGRIRFMGQAVTPETAVGLRRRMGYVIQEGGLFPHFTAYGNVALMARYLGWTGERIAARIAELLALTRFPREALERFPVELSGGQRQRVALMRALMLDPALLLLDEPMAALDPMIRFDLQEDLKAIFLSLHKTVVLVTHDLAEAAFLGDEIVLLRDGRIEQKGPMPVLIRAPATDFVRRFVAAQRGHRAGVEP